MHRQVISVFHGLFQIDQTCLCEVLNFLRQITCFGVNKLHCTISTLIYLHACLEIEIHLDVFKIL